MGRIDEFEYPAGATPLEIDEINGLIPAHVTTQGQLNEWEQVNILEAESWANRQRFDLMDIARINFMRKLHQRMFGKTWRWAGRFRQSNKNIGGDWLFISTDLKMLLDDVCYQLANKAYSMDETSARFHHRLVAIHPFVNGNGRHARLMTDILLLSQQCERFTWGGSENLITPSGIRQKYIKALRAADRRDYQLLLEFIRQ